MNIGFFTDTYKPQINGVVTSVDIYAQEFTKFGHRVYIFAPSVPGYRDNEDNVFRLRSFTFIFQPEHRVALPLPRRILKIIPELGLDIIHTHTPFTLGIWGWWLAKRYDLPLVHTYHTLFSEYVHYILSGKIFTKRMAERVSRFYCNRCDLVISPSEKVRQELIRYGVKTDISVIPTGINIEEYDPLSKEEARERLGFDEDTKILLFVGRLGKEKGIDFLLRAYAQVIGEFPKIHLFVVGDGPERDNLIEISRSLNIHGQVTFTGYLPRQVVLDYLVASDLFVFSSTTETQGLVILEAMASGTPVVAVDAMGVSDLVINESNGLLTSPHFSDFAEAIRRALNDNDLRKRMASGARKMATQLSANSSAQRMLTCYEKLKEQCLNYSEAV